jgi:hypothetical protein
MDLCTFADFLATEPEGLFMLPGALIEAQNPLQSIPYPEFFFIGLQPNECCPPVWVESRCRVTLLIRAAMALE